MKILLYAIAGLATTMAIIYAAVTDYYTIGEALLVAVFAAVAGVMLFIFGLEAFGEGGGGDGWGDGDGGGCGGGCGG